MADETHRAAIEIDGSGAAAGAAVAADAFDLIAKAAKRSGAEATAASKGHDQARKSAFNMAAALRQAAAAFGLFKLAQFAKDAVMTAARFEELGIVVQEVAKRNGIAASTINKTEAAMRRFGIAATESRSQMLKFMQAHLDLAQATDLARLAQDAAVVGGMNSSQTLARITHGIVSGQTEVLRTVGITVSFENAYRKMAKEVGIANINALTPAQKTQARFNAVMESGASLAGAYEASMTSASKQMRSWPRYLEDIKVALGEAFQPQFKAAIFAISDALQSTAKWIGANGPLIQGIVEFTKWVGGAIAAVWGLHKAFSALKLVVDLFKKSNPWFIALTGLVTVIGAIGSVMGAVKAAQTEYAEKQKKIGEESSKAREEVEKLTRAQLQAKVVQLQAVADAERARLRPLMAQVAKEERRVPRVGTDARGDATADNWAPPSGASQAARQLADLRANLNFVEQSLLDATAAYNNFDERAHQAAERAKHDKDPVESLMSEEELKRVEAAKKKLVEMFDEVALAEQALLSKDPFFEIKAKSRELAKQFLDTAKDARILGDKLGETAADTVIATAEFEKYIHALKRTQDAEIAKAQEGLMRAQSAALTEESRARLEVLAAMARDSTERKKLIVLYGEGEEAVKAYVRGQQIEARAAEIAASRGIALAQARKLATQERAEVDRVAAAQTIAAYQKETAEIAEQTKVLGMNTAQRKEFVRQKEVERLLKDNPGLSKAEAEAAVRMRQAAKDAAEFAAQIAHSSEQIRKNLIENVQRSFADLLAGLMRKGIESWRDFVNTLRDMFTTAIAQMLSAKIVGKFAAMLRGLSAAASPAAAGAGGGVMSLAGVGPDSPMLQMIPKAAQPGQQGAGGMFSGLMGSPGGKMLLQMTGGAIAGGLVGYQIGSMTTNKTMGAVGGAAGGAATGAMIGGVPGAIAGAIVGGVAGWFGASKKAKETAKLLQEAQREFTRALEGYVKTAMGTDSPVARAQRDARSQRDAMRKQANEALPGSANEAERERKLQEIEKAYANMILKISLDFQRDLEDAIDLLRGKDWDVKMREIQRQYEEFRRGLIDANLDPALAEQWYAEAKAKLEREIAAFTADFSLDLQSRQARLKGTRKGDEEAAALEIERARLREMMALEDLARAGKISAAQMEAMAKVIGEEAVKAMEDFKKAAEEAFLQRREDLGLRAAAASGLSDRELMLRQLEIQHRRELADVTDEAERALMLHVHALEKQAAAAALAAESMRTLEDLDVRRLRAEGKTTEADIQQKQNEMFREQDAYIQRFGRDSKEFRTLVEVQFAEFKAFMASLGRATTGSATDVSASIAKRESGLAAAEAQYQRLRPYGEKYAEGVRAYMIAQAEAAFRSELKGAFGASSAGAAGGAVGDAVTAGTGGGSATAGIGNATVAQADRMVTLLEQIAANTAALRSGNRAGSAPLDGRDLNQSFGSDLTVQRRLAGNSRVEIA